MPEEQELLSPYGMKSIIIIPLFMANTFWGFFSLDDCRIERSFSEEEIDILRSGSLVIISAINRNEQTTQLQKAHERTQILLDAMPMTCQLWNREGKLFDCNEESVKLFKVKDKQEFINMFPRLSPEYQSDGQLSTVKSSLNIQKAFN
jgi:PAS domain-containing protein